MYNCDNNIDDTNYITNTMTNKTNTTNTSNSNGVTISTTTNDNNDDKHLEWQSHFQSQS